MPPLDFQIGQSPKPGQKGYRLTDEQKLAMAQGRQAARERRQAERTERNAKGRDYFDVVPGDPEARAERAPNISDVVTNAVSASQSGGGAAEIAAAVAAAVAQVFAQHAPPPSPNGPRQVPPEIQKRRNLAYERMIVLIDDVKRGTRERPVYELTEDFYDGWKLIPASVTRKSPDGLSMTSRQRIVHSDQPNEYMLPVNETAREISANYMEWIGGKTPDLADQSYNAYRDRPKYEAAGSMGARLDYGAQVLNPTERPVFPDRVQPENMGAEIIMNVPEDEVVYTGPPPIMGTIKATEGPSRF